MVQDFASLYAQEEARLRHNSPEVNDVLSKIHQDSPTTNTQYMEGNQMVYFAADLRVLQ